MAASLATLRGNKMYCSLKVASSAQLMNQSQHCPASVMEGKVGVDFFGPYNAILLSVSEASKTERILGSGEGRVATAAGVVVK